MYNRNTRKKPENLLKNYILYDSFLNDEKSIVLNKDDSLQVTYKIIFPDLNFSESEREQAIFIKLNNALKKLDESFTLHVETQRKIITYDEKISDELPIPTKTICKIRKDKINKNSHFRTDYYITITYKMNILENFSFPSQFKKNLKNVKIDEKKEKKLLDERIEDFEDKISDFINRIEPLFLSIKLVKGEELLAFLYSQVALEFKEKIKVPINPHIDELVGMNILEYNNKLSKINDNFFACISIFEFPEETKTRIFEELEHLNFEYRYVVRYSIMNKNEAKQKLTVIQQHYKTGELTILQRIKQGIDNKEIQNKNEIAILNAEEVKEAINDLKAGINVFGYMTATIIVSDKSKEVLKKKIKEIKKIVDFNDFIAKNDTYNVFDSYLSAMAGNTERNIRRYPFSSSSFTCMIPVNSNFLGLEYNKHLKEAALTTAKTKSNDLFFLNLHVTDIGHTAIIGPTGAGKSVLLGLIVNQFMKYKNSQVFFFDKDRSIKVLCENSDGVFYDLGNDEFSFQIMQNIDKEHYREFVKNWLITILEQENFEKVTAEIKLQISEAVNLLANNPEEMRTFSGFYSLLANNKLKLVFENYVNGSYKKYFNKNVTMKENSFQVFEMGQLLENEKIAALVLDYLFFYIQNEKLDGRPSLIVLDEAGLLLKNEKIAKKFEEWLRVLRKKNTSVIFATQAIQEINNNELAPVVIDSCKTKILLPNENAQTWAELYYKMGLNSAEIEKVQNAIPKEEYLYKSDLGTNLINFSLSQVEIALLGSSKMEDINKMNELKASCANIEELNKEWLRYKKIM